MAKLDVASEARKSLHTNHSRSYAVAGLYK